jgi:hypothetical protein
MDITIFQHLLNDTLTFVNKRFKVGLEDQVVVSWTNYKANSQRVCSVVRSLLHLELTIGGQPISLLVLSARLEKGNVFGVGHGSGLVLKSELQCD